MPTPDDSNGPMHDPQLGVPDTGDLVGDTDPDPDPDEVTDPDDPSYVEPAAQP